MLSAAPDANNVLEFVLAFIVAGAAGFVTGLAYNIVRPLFKRLSYVGDVLTGAVLGCSLTFAILLEARLFGDDFLTSKSDRMAALAVGMALGLMGTILYWREWYHHD